MVFILRAPFFLFLFFKKFWLLLFVFNISFTIYVLTIHSEYDVYKIIVLNNNNDKYY